MHGLVLLQQFGPPIAAADPAADSIAGAVAPYMLVFFVAFFAALVVTPVMRSLALRNGIVDVPDLRRKNHVAPVAYLGGVGILAGWLAGVVVSHFIMPSHDPGAGLAPDRVVFPLSVILGAGAIVMTGLIDDVYGISPRVKVGGQFFAAAALASQNVGIRLVEGAIDVLGLTPTAWLGESGAGLLIYVLGTAVIAVFVIGGCNAVNLLDGLDGLASGVTAIAMLGFLLCAAIVAVRGDGGGLAGAVNDPVRIVMCLAVLGGVLGFLPYNFNPASIFMGDAGSLLLGYLAVATILMFADVHLKHVTAMLIVFAIPIIDTSLALIRRKVRGRPLFSPDNGHVHHQLRKRGLTVRQSVGLLYLAQIGFAAVGVALIAIDVQWRYVMAVFCVLYGSVIAFAFNIATRDAVLDGILKMRGFVSGSADDPNPDPDPDPDPNPDPAPHPAASFEGRADPVDNADADADAADREAPASSRPQRSGG